MQGNQIINEGVICCTLKWQNLITVTRPNLIISDEEKVNKSVTNKKSQNKNKFLTIFYLLVSCYISNFWTMIA